MDVYAGSMRMGAPPLQPVGAAHSLQQGLAGCEHDKKYAVGWCTSLLPDLVLHESAWTPSVTSQHTGTSYVIHIFSTCWDISNKIICCIFDNVD